MVNIYTGSNNVEHFLGGVTKHRINTINFPYELETLFFIGYMYRVATNDWRNSVGNMGLEQGGSP